MFNLPITIQIRLWGGFLNRIITSSIFPFIVLYISDVFTIKFTGYFMMLIVIISFISDFISGYIIDIFSRKKTLLFSAYTESLTFFFLGVSYFFEEYIVFILLYILYTIVSSVRRLSLKVLVQDAVTKENKKKTYVLDYWLVNLSLSIGLILGGVFYNLDSLILFFLAAISTLILSVIYSIYIVDNRNLNMQFKERHVNIYNAYKNVFLNKVYIKLVIGISLIYLAELFIGSYKTINLKQNFEDIKINEMVINGVTVLIIIQLINTFGAIFFTLWLPQYLSKKINNMIQLKLGMLCYVIGYSLLIYSNDIIFIIMFAIIATVGEVLYAPIYNSEIIEHIPYSERGVYNSISSLGLTFSDLLAKSSIVLSTYFTVKEVSIALLFLLSVGAILLIKNIFKSEKKEVKEC